MALSSPSYALEVHQLTKCYGEVVAVDGISFKVKTGIICGLLGGNGAGKTTTIGLLLGLLMPSAGEIHILGSDMKRNRYAALGRMNFSSPYVDLPHRLTVVQNLRVYARLYGVKDIRARLETLGEELGISPFLKRRYGTLSAGQKTRVALAKALLNSPDLLLLDEPTASLDPDSADRIRVYLKDYQRRTSATVLLASHNMPEVERICDDVIMLRSGQVVDRGTPHSLIGRYGRQTMEQVFLDIARARRVEPDATSKHRRTG